VVIFIFFFFFFCFHLIVVLVLFFFFQYSTLSLPTGNVFVRESARDVINVNEGRGRRSGPSSCESRPDPIQFVGRHDGCDRRVDPPRIRAGAG